MGPAKTRQQEPRWLIRDTQVVAVVVVVGVFFVSPSCESTEKRRFTAQLSSFVRDIARPQTYFARCASILKRAFDR